jgi:hypothetical protein
MSNSNNKLEVLINQVSKQNRVLKQKSNNQGKNQIKLPNILISFMNYLL